MRRLLTSALIGALLVGSAVAPATADEPTEVRVIEQFADVDPCTGDAHEVTLDVTFHMHSHDDRTVARGVRTITTSSGDAGRGTSSYVLNDEVEKFRFSDRLTDDAGNRIRATGLLVLDLSSGIARVDSFDLTCVGS